MERSTEFFEQQELYLQLATSIEDVVNGLNLNMTEKQLNAPLLQGKTSSIKELTDSLTLYGQQATRNQLERPDWKELPKFASLLSELAKHLLRFSDQTGPAIPPNPTDRPPDINNPQHPTNDTTRDQVLSESYILEGASEYLYDSYQRYPCTSYTARL